ncbi:hypothetical protein KKA14_07595 [bacterium]|nr:hypothetical protein [bacterium]
MRKSLNGLIFILLFLFFTNPIEAIEFKESLRIGESLKYKHWNVKKNRITGYSVLDYSVFREEGKEYILESTQNVDEKGSVYSRKRSLFDFYTGRLERYEEHDLRTGMRVIDQFENTQVITQVIENDISKNISMKMDPDLVPMEVLTLSLQEKIPIFLKKQPYRFSLYLPAIAIELDKKNFPLSFSKIAFVASVENISEMDTVLGRRKTIKILVKVDSFFLSTLLPKDKTEFRFTYLTEPPYYLVAFEDIEGQIILMQITQKKSPK